MKTRKLKKPEKFGHVRKSVVCGDNALNHQFSMKKISTF
jgi:hypothetical protein